MAWSCLQGIPSLSELKLRYYELMIVYHQHYHNYLEICRCYKAIYESDGVQADPAQWQPVSQAGHASRATAACGWWLNTPHKVHASTENLEGSASCVPWWRPVAPAPYRA